MELLDYYWKSRIVSINANVIIAGIIAITLSVYPVYLTKMITDDPLTIALISFGIDAFFDFTAFSLLHLNVHRRYLRGWVPSRSLGEDLFWVNTHRATLSVIYFFIAVGIHSLLIMSGKGRVASYLISYLFALTITRLVHTAYGLKTGLFKPLKK